MYYRLLPFLAIVQQYCLLQMFSIVRVKSEEANKYDDNNDEYTHQQGAKVVQPQNRIVPLPEPIHDMEILFESYLEIQTGFSQYKRCGGSVIERRKIVTAAHCFKNLTEGDFSGVAYYGWHEHQETATFHQFISHPKYDEKRKDDAQNDIAILILDNDVRETFYSEYAEIDWGSVKVGDIIDVYGRGVLENYQRPQQLQKGTFKVVQIDKKTFVTSGLSQYGTERVTEGDSGGPAVRNGRLVGVTVGTREDNIYHSVFASVAANKNFIMQNISHLTGRYEKAFYQKRIFWMLAGSFVAILFLVCYVVIRIDKQTIASRSKIAKRSYISTRRRSSNREK